MLKIQTAPVRIRSAAREYSSDGSRAVNAPTPLRLSYFVLAAIALSLVVPFLIMNGLRTDPAVAEWWTRNIARGWEAALGAMTSFMPVSVFEVLVALLVLVGVYLFFRLVINLCYARFKAILKGLLIIAVGAMYVLDLYTLSMGFGYYRATMPLPMSGGDYDLRQTIAVAEYALEDYNTLAQKFERDDNGCVICPYTFDELARRLSEEYSRLDDDYFAAYTPTAKPMVNSWLLSDLNITGITFLPTGEANLNIEAPPTSVPYTMAHELAHTKGVQREGDANLLAAYILLSSDDEYLRYCGYYANFFDIAHSVLLAGGELEYGELYDRVSRLTVIEHRYSYAFWRSHPDIIGEIGEFFNDIYLKLNGAFNGKDSYDDGNITDKLPVIDPSTGEQEVDPETQKPVYVPVYSSLQKMYFALYEKNCGVPPMD